MITLNLIPRSERSSYKQRLYLISIRTFSISIVGFLAIIAVLLVGNNIMLTQQMNSVEQDIQEAMQATVIEEGGSLQDNIRKINTELSSIQTIQSSYTESSDLIVNLLNSIPDGIHLSLLTIDTENLTILVRGIADARSDFITLRDTLSAQSYLSNPQSPYTDVTQRTDIEFDFTATLNEDYSDLISNQHDNN
ncbi:PilN domain-containing protein [Patescibacteria group bacterium]